MAETKAVYLTACLLKFYQQLDIYEDKAQALHSFNIEKPLWVFVGSTVTAGKLGKDEQIVATDVAPQTISKKKYSNIELNGPDYYYY